MTTRKTLICEGACNGARLDLARAILARTTRGRPLSIPDADQVRKLHHTPHEWAGPYALAGRDGPEYRELWRCVRCGHARIYG